MKRYRLLDFLLSRNPQFTKKELYSRIMCGEVQVDGSVIRDTGFPVTEETLVSLSSKEYVSRGGYKLKTAIDAWNIDVKARVMLDAGASTGGFTDVLLKNGASKVYAVDVGYNQLDYSLRTDDRVVVMEKTNIMDLSSLSPAPHGAVADLSFRSLKGAAGKLISLTSEHWCICLIKPQFEIEADTPGFNGVIRDTGVMERVVRKTILDMEADGLKPVRLIPSSVKGTKGNQEFLVLIDQDAVFSDRKDDAMIDGALSGL